MTYPALVIAPTRLVSVLLAVTGALVASWGFADVGWWPAAILGTGMLFLAAGRDSARWNTLVGLSWGIVFFAIHIYWARVATDQIAWIALTVLESVFVAGSMAAYAWARRAPWGSRPWYRVAAAATCFVAFEQARALIPFGGFPWGLLAFSQVDSPLGRLAWAGGEVAVSLAVAITGALLAVVVALAWARATTLRGLVAATVTITALFTAGALVRLDTAPQAGVLRVGAVQGNVTKPGLGSFANRGEVLANHVEGTIALADDVGAGELDIVLWPENGSDLDPQQVPSVARDIDAAARAAGAPILVGAQEYPASGGRYNVALLWHEGVGVTDRYAKQHPAPFGEYIPLRGFVRVFSDQVDRVTTDMIAGEEVGIVELDSPRLGRVVPIGVGICFEVAYQTLIRDSVTAGAELLVIPTNNASFGRTAESTQQLAMSRLRAITTGRATVQISTVGVSGLIRPDGTLIETTGLFTADQMSADLPLRTSITPAIRLAAAPAITVGTAAAIMVLAGVRARVGARRASRATA